MPDRTNRAIEGVVGGMLLAGALVGGALLLQGEPAALTGDQAAAWAEVNDAILPALGAEREAGGRVAELTAAVAAAQARLAELQAELAAAQAAQPATRAAAQAARSRYGLLAGTLAKLPASLRTSGQIVQIEAYKEPRQAGEEKP